MSIMNKPDLTIFAGEAKTGEIEAFPSVPRGWGVTLEQTAGKPPMEWFNGLGKRNDEWLMYLTQRGIAEWDVAVDYPKYALSQHNGKLYIAMEENRGQQPDRSQNAWQTLSDYLGVAKVDAIYPVGVVMFFAENKDPNLLFPGTTWKYIGENRTIRLAAATGADVMMTGGTDSVTLAVGNLPAHGHTFSANTNSFDYGTKTTSNFDYGTKASNTAGAHTHTFKGPKWEWKSATSNGSYEMGINTGTTTTSSADAHSHTIAIGAHTHSVGIGAHTHAVSGTTANTGSGTAFSVANPFIKLMGWYRSA